MASTNSQNGTTSRLLEEINQSHGISQLLGLKAKQSIERNLVREDESLVRDEQYMEALLYKDVATGGATDNGAPADEKATDEAEAGMSNEEDGFRVNDVAGNITVHLHQKDKPAAVEKSSILPLALSALGLVGSGAGITALAYTLLKPSEKTEIVIPTPDTDTTGVIGIDRDETPPPQ